MRSSRRAASNAASPRSSPKIDRVARFGFTATELNRQELNLQRFLENAVVEKDKSPSGPLADEFIRNFIQGEPIPGIVYEYGLNQRFLPEITLAEVNALAKEWMPDRNRARRRSARPRRIGRPCRPRRSWRRSSTAASRRDR